MSLPLIAVVLAPLLISILGIFVLPLKTISLIGFQGAGSDYAWLIATEPLIYAGHVALSYDGGYHYYRFTPYAPGWDNESLMAALKDHQVFPGIVSDDTALFSAAVERYAQEIRTPVYEWRQRYSVWRWFWIRWRVRRAVRRSPLRITYGFFEPGIECYNCATWPATVGVAIPEPRGLLRYYIVALADQGKKRVWQPK